MFRSLFTSVAVLGISASAAAAAAADNSLTIYTPMIFMRNLSLYQNVTVVVALKIMLKASALGALLVWSLLLMLRELGREIRSCLMAAINFKAPCFTPVTRVNWPQG